MMNDEQIYMHPQICPSCNKAMCCVADDKLCQCLRGFSFVEEVSQQYVQPSNRIFLDKDIQTAVDTSFKEFWNNRQTDSYQVSRSKGWFLKDVNLLEQFMLVVSEIGEATDAYREGNPESVKIPGFTHIEEELADVVLRCMNISEHFKFRLAEAVIAKNEYNKTRPYQHGGKKV